MKTAIFNAKGKKKPMVSLYKVYTEQEQNLHIATRPWAVPRIF